MTAHGWDHPTAVKAAQAQIVLLQEMQAALGDTHVLLAKETGDVPAVDAPYVNTLMMTDTFCSSYARGGKMTYNATQCKLDIETIAAAAKRGQLTETHSLGFQNDTAQREFCIACFLVGMGNLSYYAHADEAGAWSLSGLHWWPEYDYPLGPPLSDAHVNDAGWVYTRTFKSGTSVWVDVEHHRANISWATRQ